MRLSRKLSVVVFLLSFASVAFGQSKTEYQKYLAKAKEYESQKRWVYALDAYYDAMGTDEKTENKMEAYERYNALADAIKSGNPGLGKFDKSLIHNEWKKLLIDTEKYGCSICKYDIIVNLKDSYLNSKTKTTTVSFTIDYLFGNRYSKTIGVIEEGYKVALNKAKSSSDYTFDYLYGDWEGIPKDWPIHSVSSRQDDYKNYNRNGTLFYDYAYGWVSPELEVVPMSGKNDYLNAFMADEIQTFDYYEGSPFKTPYEFEFNIIDSKGKELAKSDKISLGNNKIIYFNGLRSDIVELIKSGQATINLKNCYLKYGMYLYNRGTKSLKEQKIVKETVSLISWFDYIDSRMISLDEIAIKMLNTEVTQELYESIMESNPSSNKGKKLPVESVSWFDAVYFCNKLSVLAGLTPVYSINGFTDLLEWKYRYYYEPHTGLPPLAPVIENEAANGFRLPILEEWVYAAKGKNVNGSDYNIIAWFKENSSGSTHPVAQKQANEFGLYDIYGNVKEWNSYSMMDRSMPTRIYGGSYYDNASTISIDSFSSGLSSTQYTNVGFRIVRINEEILQKIQQSLIADFFNRTNSTFMDDENLDFGSIGYIDVFEGKSYFSRLKAVANQTSSQKGLNPCYYQKINGKNVYDISKWDLSKTVYYDEAGTGFFIRGNSKDDLSLCRKATEKELSEYNKSKTEVIKSYFEKLSINGKIEENSGSLIYKIPLDNSYNGNSSFILKDSSGKTWTITHSDFLSKLKEITSQDYSISFSALTRKVTDQEKVDYENSKREVIKNYYDKISVNGDYEEIYNDIVFSIPLDNSYDTYGFFKLEDSSGKTWDITQTEFISELRDVTDQEYRIISSKLTRNTTEKERTLYLSKKELLINEAILAYYEKLRINGKIGNHSESSLASISNLNMNSLIFRIPLDSSFNEYSRTFNLNDSSGKIYTLKAGDFLNRLNEMTNQNYYLYNSTQMDIYYIYRDVE